MSLTIEIGPHLRLVLVVATLAWLVVAWWSYRSGGRRP